MFFIHRYAVNAFAAKGVHYIGKPGHAFEYAFHNNRLHYIELKLTRLGREVDCGIVAEHLEAYLVSDFGDYGINLSGHD